MKRRSPANTIPSPCIGVCTLDEASGYCKGCFRTGEEVAGWLYYTAAEKQQVWEKLEARRKTWT